MARATGLEPALHFCSALKGQWLYQFAYTRIKMVVRVGLAPTLFLVWQIYSLLPSLLSGT